MKKEKIFIFICLVLLSACSPSSLDGIVIEKAADGYKLSIDGRETYIKGVGGTYRLDIAAQSGANAFRTWGGNVEEIKKNLALASEHNMYVMQGIGMTKDSIRYYDDEYKNKCAKKSACWQKRSRMIRVCWLGVLAMKLSWEMLI